MNKNGGEGGIRTHEAVPRLLALQASALDQLSHLSAIWKAPEIGLRIYGGESGIRTHEAVPRLLAFEASAFDQLSHLSASYMKNINAYLKRTSQATRRLLPP